MPRCGPGAGPGAPPGQAGFLGARPLSLLFTRFAGVTAPLGHRPFKVALVGVPCTPLPHFRTGQRGALPLSTRTSRTPHAHHTHCPSGAPTALCLLSTDPNPDHESSRPGLTGSGPRPHGPPMGQPSVGPDAPLSGSLPHAEMLTESRQKVSSLPAPSPSPVPSPGTVLGPARRRADARPAAGSSHLATTLDGPVLGGFTLDVKNVFDLSLSGNGAAVVSKSNRQDRAAGRVWGHPWDGSRSDTAGPSCGVFAAAPTCPVGLSQPLDPCRDAGPTGSGCPVQSRCDSARASPHLTFS